MRQASGSVREFLWVVTQQFVVTALLMGMFEIIFFRSVGVKEVPPLVHFILPITAIPIGYAVVVAFFPWVRAAWLRRRYNMMFILWSIGGILVGELGLILTVKFPNVFPHLR